MSGKITLVVRFRMDESAKHEFTTKLKEVFTDIVKEPTFIEASLVQDMQDPQSLLIYEVWLETSDSFMKNQMTRLIELNTKRCWSISRSSARWLGIPVSASGRELRTWGPGEQCYGSYLERSCPSV